MSSPNASTASSQPTAEPSWQTKYPSEMTPAERLLSLQSWAESKKFVTPGESGTLPSAPTMSALALSGGGGGASRNSAVGNGKGGDRYAGQYEGVVGPPSYQSAVSDGSGGRERKRSFVGKLFRKKEKGRGEEDRMEEERREEGRVPEYVP